MSVVVARDETTAGHIIFPWPEPVPWGAELVCAEEEVVIVCPNWQVGDELGPGRHTISPPDPQSHILAYFFRTTPEQVHFERLISVLDRANNQTTRVHYRGRARIKVGNPMLMCHQLVGLPYHDLATGVLTSAANSLGKVFQHVISKVCMSSPSVDTIANPEAVDQLIQMAANANPMAIAVTGLELVGFDEYQLSIETGESIHWSNAAGKARRFSTSDESEPTARLPAADADAPAGGDGPVGSRGSQSSPASQDSIDDSVEQAVSSPEIAFPGGTAVLVYWHDGLWHKAVIQQYEGGRYQVTLDDSDTTAWVPANQIRPT